MTRAAESTRTELQRLLQVIATRVIRAREEKGPLRDGASFVFDVESVDEFEPLVLARIPWRGTDSPPWRVLECPGSLCRYATAFSQCS